MKVIKLTDEDDADFLRKKERVAIGTLKLAGDGSYVKGVGMRDGDFYLLEETSEDSEYMAFIGNVDPTQRQWLVDTILTNGVKNTLDIDLPPIPEGSTLVFFKKIRRKKYLFRTLWDFKIQEKVAV
jgi:hypothetical protein